MGDVRRDLGKDSIFLISVEFWSRNNPGLENCSVSLSLPLVATSFAVPFAPGQKL